ncbi:MAG TPA: dephospho-CoA kinase [Pseudolysinimonas sp.]|nr:dephospho-CoA kinase [Pseudolysinimonas sp.]
MTLVGLTGGIASGKSLVAARFAELGAVVVDADAVAREVVEPGQPALAAISERFGPGVLASDGRLDRAALGSLVFADDDARLALNAITHPAVKARSHELFEQAWADDPAAIVVYDVPLLVEGRVRGGEFDTIVVVEADDEVRVRRMIDERGMSEDDARRRIAAQADNATRRSIADFVIDTNGTIAETLARTDEVWAQLSAAA